MARGAEPRRVENLTANPSPLGWPRIPPEVRERLDHRHLNHDVAIFREGGKIPTTENLLIHLWERLAPRVEGARLVRLRLREDVDLFADYYGPEKEAGPHREALA